MQEASSNLFQQAKDHRNPVLLAKNISEWVSRSANLAIKLGTGENGDNSSQAFNSVTNISEILMQLGKNYIKRPDQLIRLQFDLLQSQTKIWQSGFQRMLNPNNSKPSSTQYKDRRFKDASWQDEPFFELLSQAYLATTDWAQKMVVHAQGMEPHEQQKAKFYIEQLTNALSPSNFIFTNPEILHLILESNGQNLIDGMDQLEEDLANGFDFVRVKQADLTAFEVGKNIATTPGKVIFRNEMMELIQYTPTTEKVYKTPLLIVPPWINKYYILDLNEKKSFIRWAVSQGLSVYIISWKNPTAEMAHKDIGDYMEEGVFAALDVICDTTGQKQVNTIGYCIGGTLLSIALAVMASKEDKRIRSATFFTTQVDFSKAGELLVFINEEEIQGLEKKMAQTGYLDASEMASAFNMLRSNDLIWSYLINNYLKGQRPRAFDLLFWNSDSTRLPAKMHSNYLRSCYLNNLLSQGKMVVKGITVDLKKIKVPVYNLAAREDHIAPLESVCRMDEFFGSKVRLVVSGSGHIAGVINPPAANKYYYKTNDNKVDDIEEWLEGAEETQGSWWGDWAKWVSKRSGAKIDAPVLDETNKNIKILADAPGVYVREKLKG